MRVAEATWSHTIGIFAGGIRRRYPFHLLRFPPPHPAPSPPPPQQPGSRALPLNKQLARQPALKITRLSSRRTCFAEDPAPGNNRRVPGCVSGAGHGGGDTRLPGVIAGVSETDAIWSAGGEGWDWAGHTLSLQHFSLSRATLSQAAGMSPSGGRPYLPLHPRPPNTHTYTIACGEAVDHSLPPQPGLGLGLPPSRMIKIHSGSVRQEAGGENFY